jgi:exosortase
VVRQEVAIPLQALTARVTHGVLETIGVGSEVSGNVLRINGVDVAIAEACNGMRMVFALVLVSFAFAFGTPLRHRVRVLVLLASPISAIVCNVLRLVPTVWVYGTGAEELGDFLHDIGGWLMLPASFLALVGALRLLRWAQVPVTRFTMVYGA